MLLEVEVDETDPSVDETEPSFTTMAKSVLSVLVLDLLEFSHMRYSELTFKKHRCIDDFDIFKQT